MIPLNGIPTYLSPPLLLAALVLMGLVVGTLTGLFGVGGGFIMTPLLNILLGIPYPLAVGSDLCAIIGTSSSGVARHMRLRNFEPRGMLILAACSMAGAVLGAEICQRLRHACPESFTPLMHGFFIVLLLVTAWVVAGGRGQDRQGRSLLQRLPLPPRIDLPAANIQGVSVPGLALLGVALGILSGLLGIGGGVLLLPALIVAVGLEPHQAVGTSLGVVLLSAIAGTVKHGLMGNVSLWLVTAIMFGGTLGVQLGAWLCLRLRAQKLQRYFGLMVLIVAGIIAADLARRLLGGK